MKRFKEEISAYRDELGPNTNVDNVRKENKFKKSLKDVHSNITRTRKKLNDYETRPHLRASQIKNMETTQDCLSELREEEANTNI